MNLAPHTRFMDELLDREIPYFSYTLFNGERIYLSYSSSQEWLNIYRGLYESTLGSPPPVQKYITSSRISLLLWDSTEIDESARRYIHDRNDIVEASSNVTVVNRFMNQTTALTFSSPKDESHILKFVQRDAALVNRICHYYNDLFKKSLESGWSATGV
jgi:hypothetical protein